MEMAMVEIRTLRSEFGPHFQADESMPMSEAKKIRQAKPVLHSPHKKAPVFRSFFYGNGDYASFSFSSSATMGMSAGAKV